MRGKHSSEVGRRLAACSRAPKCARAAHSGEVDVVPEMLAAEAEQVSGDREGVADFAYRGGGAGPAPRLAPEELCSIPAGRPAPAIGRAFAL